MIGGFYGDVICKNRQKMQNIAKSHTSTTDAVTLVLEHHLIGQILRQVSEECIERSYQCALDLPKSASKVGVFFEPFFPKNVFGHYSAKKGPTQN